MDEIYKNILQEALSSYSAEGVILLHDGIVRGVEPSYLVRQMPVIDRLQLYSRLVDPENLKTDGIPAAVRSRLISAISNSIDWKSTGTLESAIEVVLGRREIRVKDDTQEGAKVKSPDGYLSNNEGISQSWLAYTITSDMPVGTATSATEYVKTRIDEDEQGKAIAFLSAKPAPSNYPQKARDLLLANCALTPALWNAFRSTCQDIDKNERGYKIDNFHSGYMVEAIQSLVDRIVGREIFALTPDRIAALPDNRAYSFASALTSVSGVGLLNDEARRMQAYLYRHLSVAKEVDVLRTEQIGKFVDYFSGLSDEAVDAWIDIKHRWTLLSSEEKSNAIKPYFLALKDALGTPHAPEVIVAAWDNAPYRYDWKVRPNGYFVGWRTKTENGKQEDRWINKVVLIDDAENDAPLSVKASFRSGISTGTHEYLHSDYEQYQNRYANNSSRHACYMAAFDDKDAPAKITFDDKLGHAVCILNYTNAPSGQRKAYISADSNYELYRQQPTEKWVWSYQNQFTAALNGTIVARQVRRGERTLHKELRDVFIKAGKVLSARAALTGQKSDLQPLVNYDRASHPFGALTTHDDEAAVTGNRLLSETDGSNYVAVDFTKYTGKADVLTYLQRSLEHMVVKGAHDDKDFAPIFLQSADFLAQMPKELWAIKRRLRPEESALAVKLDALATTCQDLSADLNDFAFVLHKPVQRQNVVASLSAAL